MPMKNHHRYLLIIGIWVILVPFFGVPILWKKILLAIPGIILITMAVSIIQTLNKKKKKGSEYPFKENGPVQKIETQDDELVISSREDSDVSPSEKIDETPQS